MKFYIKWEYIVLTFLAILAFVLLFGFIFSTFNPTKAFDGFTIAISFAGLFTTFGGAYLGAKISGENSKELFKNELRIRDIENHMAINVKVLSQIEKIENLIKNIKELNNRGDFYNPYTYKKVFDLNNDIYTKIETIKENYIDEASININIEFDYFYEAIYDLTEFVKNYFGIDTTEEMLKPFLDKNEEFNGTINPWVFFYPNKNNIYIYVIKNGEPIQKPVQLQKIYDLNKKLFLKYQMDVNNLIKKIESTYDKMQYKSRDDLKAVYKKLNRL
ncbi:hypothetical protein [Staphylococcus xylosus]|uniref:hypothetical protein n=1 Tax=Staphylococcus xylosus TaxID=1288 RepID=UPI001C3EFDFD|nr:hypothetical protein [Staphylococcus xylosus]